MANLMDYMAWRGDLSLSAAPWNEVDALMMSNLCYLNFQGIDDQRGWTLAEAKRQNLMVETNVSNFEGRRNQFLAMAETRRFGGVRMHHFIALTDEKQGLQFSATCYDLPDGTLCIGFRGTDGTLVGWREDFNMSWQSMVPAQEAAVFYLERAAEMDNRPIRIVGHSKGGNLAAYAAACCGPEVRERLLAVYSFDGPGMDPEVFAGEGYQAVVDKIISIVPQTSIVGMMMEYHRRYTVVRSDATGINQHDPLTWQVCGPRFETLEKIDSNAEMVSDTLHEWLEKTNREERSRMVDTLFNLLENTRATSVTEMMGEPIRTLTGVAVGTWELDPASRKAVTKLLGLFVSLGFGTLTERVRRNRPAEESGKETPEQERAPRAGLFHLRRMAQQEKAHEQEAPEEARERIPEEARGQQLERFHEEEAPEKAHGQTTEETSVQQPERSDKQESPEETPGAAGGENAGAAEESP